MELREYLQIIKKYIKEFFATWGVILFLPLFTVFVQPIIYEGEMTVMVIRKDVSSGLKVSEEYDYYYQLEADKKIADILVQFLEDKSVLDRSFAGSGDDEAGDRKIAISKDEKMWIISKIKGEALGGGYVKIKVFSHTEELVGQVSDRLFRQLEDKIAKVGIDKSRLVGLEVEPIVTVQKNKLYLPVGLGAFFGGLLVAIFAVLIVHYWRDED